MRRDEIALLSSCLLALALTGCRRSIDLSSSFSFPVNAVRISSENKEMSVEMKPLSASQFEHASHDSLLVSCEHKKPFLFSVTNLPNGDLIGTFCPKGRSAEEPLDILPHIVSNTVNGEFLIDFLSYPTCQIFTWNVTRSCEEETTLYDTILNLYPEPKEQFTPTSFFVLSGSEAAVLNSRQNLSGFHSENAMPTWEIYDTTSGSLVRTYGMYHHREFPLATAHGESIQFFLASKECIRPDRSRIASAMLYLPQINLLDPATGELRGIRTGKTAIDPEHPVMHFYDVKCDGEYIYALYLGTEQDKADDNPASWVFVFDWDGQPVTKFRAANATGLFLDGDTLYMTNYMHSTLASVYLNDIL